MERAILAGPFIGELGWLLLRFGPHAIWKKKVKFKGKVKLIAYIREDSFDVFGRNADILVPLRIKGDFVKYKPECFRAIRFSVKVYEKMAKNFREQFSKKYNIVDHIYPNIRKPHFLNKNMYPEKQRLYEYLPRKVNKKLVDKYIPNDKPIVVLGPRFRKGFRRNWYYWQHFYNMIATTPELANNYHFVICGKAPEYVPDEKQRFFDINSIENHENSSLVGLTIETVRRASLVVGSQSAIPNVGMILGTEVLQWGNEPREHTKVYNVFDTRINFITDRHYKVKPEKVMKEMTKMLNSKGVKK